MNRTRAKRSRSAPHIRHRIQCGEPQTDLDYLLQPFFCELSDEAAAQIAQLLMDLALCFESTHLSQITRHHEAGRPLPPHDPRQLELFEPF